MNLFVSKAHDKNIVQKGEADVPLKYFAIHRRKCEY